MKTCQIIKLNIEYVLKTLLFFIAIHSIYLTSLPICNSSTDLVAAEDEE